MQTYTVTVTHVATKQVTAARVQAPNAFSAAHVLMRQVAKATGLPAYKGRSKWPLYAYTAVPVGGGVAVAYAGNRQRAMFYTAAA